MAKKPVDPGEKSVADFLKSYPVGKLIACVIALLSVGGGGGRLYAEGEIRELKATAAAWQRTAETLQQAIVAGNCVKSRELQRVEAARSIVAKLARIRLDVAFIRNRLEQEKIGYETVGVPAWEADPSFGLFLDDRRVEETLFDVNEAAYDANVLATAYKRDEEYPARLAALDRLVASTSAAEEYLRAKYLMLEPRSASSP
jgi:hypothetical protein